MNARRRIRRHTHGESSASALLMAIIAAALSIFIIYIMIINSPILSETVDWVLPVSGQQSGLFSVLFPKEVLSVMNILREPESEPYFSSEEGFEEFAPVKPIEDTPSSPSTPSPSSDTSIPENAHPIIDLTVTPTSDSGYRFYQNVFINNSTDYTISISDLLKKKLPAISDAAPQVLIVHSHATEAYTAEGICYFTDDSTYRSTDKSLNVVAVGKVLADELTAKGLRVIHDTTLNDYPQYSGSYTRMLKIIESYLEKYPSISCVLDVHRDSMISADNSKQYKVITDINDISAAQIMIVAGSAQGGLPHPNWQENLSFAVKLQNNLETNFPTLTRPIHLRQERFNQQITPRSLILEMGTSANTLAEAKYSAKLVAQSLYAVLTQNP